MITKRDVELKKAKPLLENEKETFAKLKSGIANLEEALNMGSHYKTGLGYGSNFVKECEGGVEIFLGRRV